MMKNVLVTSSHSSQSQSQSLWVTKLDQWLRSQVKKESLSCLPKLTCFDTFCGAFCIQIHQDTYEVNVSVTPGNVSHKSCGLVDHHMFVSITATEPK